MDMHGARFFWMVAFYPRPSSPIDRNYEGASLASAPLRGDAINCLSLFLLLFPRQGRGSIGKTCFL
jgi:hypothetical protein